MPSPTRLELFAQAAIKMRADFASLTPIPHNALKGHEAEAVVRQFLNGHLPKRFAAGAGFLLDLKGDISPQTDVVLYDAFNCPVYRASDSAAIFPTNNVAAVIEVKSRLTRTEVLDAAKKIARIKALTKAPPVDGPEYESAQTLGLVFAFTSENTLEATSDHLVETIDVHHLGRHIDMIAVLDRGIVTLVAKPRGSPNWLLSRLEGLGGAAGEGTHIGASSTPFGDHTLDVFFRYLLTHLAHFRHIIDHPGFDFSAFPGDVKQQVRYLFSATNETDPKRRHEVLEKYKQEVISEFARVRSERSAG